MDEEKYSIARAKTSTEETSEEFKNSLEIKKLKRKYFIEKVNDYATTIITNFLVGGTLAIGISELLFPHLLSLTLAAPITPSALISVSMAFLLKKRVISIVYLAVRSLDPDDDEDFFNR